MSESSSIFLTEHQLIAPLGGDSISLAKSSLISTSAVSSSSGATTNLLEIETYDQTQPNVLLNGDFATGTFSGWTNSGTTIVSGSLPGKEYMVNVLNLTSLTQTVTGFDNKNVVVTVWHFGAPVVASLELDDNSDILKSSSNKVFTQSDVWTRYSLGFYGSTTGGTKAKITFSSVDDNAYIADVQMLKLDNYVSLNVGDAYLDNRNMVSISGQKLFVSDGSQLASSRTEMLDIRGDGFFSGSLNVNGSINANIIYGPPGTLKWVSNLIFSSSDSDTIVWTSGLLQTIDVVSYGLESGSTGNMIATTYIYLNLNISSTILQTSTSYVDCIGNEIIFVGIAVPGTSGNASFTSMSNQQPLINGSTQISAGSIINGNMSINSITASNIVASTITADKMNISTLSALTANLGSITAGTITLSAAGSYLNFGALPPISSSGTGGLAGLFQDYTGLYSLSGTTLNASLTQNGLSAGGGSFIADATGISLSVPNSYASTNSLSFKNSGSIEGYLYVFDDGATGNLGLVIDGSSSGLNVSRPMYAALQSYSKNTNDAGVYISASRTSSATAQIVLTSTTQSMIVLNSLAQNVDTNIQGGSDTSLFYSDASTDRIGIGTNNPASKLHISGGGITLEEMVDPSAPAADRGILYIKDNGAGKTQLVIKFNTGIVQIIATQP